MQAVQQGEPEFESYVPWLAFGTLAMVERGGPTTQAGIHYQNSVAALYLGDLLGWDVVNPAERVVEVRLEAPTDVDDIVVRFADGHRDWTQVKLDLEPRGNAWEKLWCDFAQQRGNDVFGYPSSEHLAQLAA